MKISEQLTAARKLIEKPENWTQGDYARDRDKRGVDPFSMHATCFCALGAVRVASGVNKDYTPAHNVLSAVAKGSISVDVFNDEHTHAEVLNLFDAAISIAVQQELQD